MENLEGFVKTIFVPVEIGIQEQGKNMWIAGLG